MIKEAKSLTTIFDNIEDSKLLEIFKTNSFFQTNLNSLQILLYIDDAYTTADKGNRSKKNKLCFVYCSLGNLKRKDRSTFIAINLVAIFRNTTVKQFGLNVLLRPLYQMKTPVPPPFYSNSLLLPPATDN